MIILAVALVGPAMAQNTKGDRAQDNRGTVRRTEGKSVKKKSKASTRDIAGRRLRTKNKSSVNRANANHPQPITTQRQPSRRTDRAARVPAERRFASRERRRSDPDRGWEGDISGYKSRRIEPSKSDANRANVYPQGKFATPHPQPKQRPFKGYENKTSSGKPIIKRTPQRTERAWKGDMKGQPFYPPSSQTGRYSNVHPQRTRYSKYVSKNPSPRDRAYSNREKVARARAMGTPTGAKSWGRGATGGPPGQAPFVTRGRKNVYWGKMKVGGRAITRDQAGRPISKRNFRSQGMGLVGRDTLAFFNRKPGEGQIAARKRKGRFLPGSEAKGGWLNDIAGYRLRKRTPGGAEFTRADKSYKQSTGFRSKNPIPGKTPGIGASSIERGMRRMGNGNGKNFGDQGGGFTGSLRSKKRAGQFSGSRGAMWNNNGSAIAGKGATTSGIAAGKFSGRLRGGKNINAVGSDYTGSIKRRKMFPEEEYAYRGFIKGGKKNGKYIGSAHSLWNNKGKATTELQVTRSGALAGSYSGNFKRKKMFPEEEYAYRGFEKGSGKNGKYVGTVHRLWNNQGKAVTELEVTRGGALAGTYQGNVKPGYRGKYVGTVHRLWNNQGKAVTELEVTKGGALAGTYQGNLKPGYRGKSVAKVGKSWNNQGKAVTELEVTKSGAIAGNYSGRMKAKKKEEYPLNSTRKDWNNNGKATTQLQVTAAGAKSGRFSGNTKYKKETKYRDVEIEDRMKLKKEYVQNPHSVELATKKEKPEVNYKAGRFATGAKINGSRKHSPNSVDDAIDMYHNSAVARRTDYQGNVKMRKFVDRRESPDAKFIHNGENNVKEERTIMTNMKLLWAKMFQKSESQPANLKDKPGKMRYDKGEKGMWAD